MTLTEAVAGGVTRLRKPYWNARAYIEIRISDGALEPWAQLYDPYAALALPAPRIPVDVPIVGNRDYDWLPFAGRIYQGETIEQVLAQDRQDRR